MTVETTRYQIAEGVLARPLGESIVLFHPKTERLLTLNGTGPRVWALLTESADTAQIIARLADEYDGPPALIEQQTLAFFDQLEAEQILRRAPEARPVPRP